MNSDSIKSPNNIIENQMEEFQKVLNMAANSSATSPLTPREVLVRSPEDGYLHPEGGHNCGNYCILGLFQNDLFSIGYNN